MWLVCIGVGVVAALGAVGCGPSGSSSGAAQAGPAAIAPPSVPTAAGCGVGASAGLDAAAGKKRDGRRRPPPAGAYLYRTKGKLGVPEEAVRAGDVPAVTKTIVTRPIHLGGLVCFRIQKRYTPQIVNTETYLIRGDELFLVGLRIQASGRSREIRPDPAVLFANESGSKWSGQFSGSTAGSYGATGLGKRRLRLDGKEIRVTGLRSAVTYRGAVSGRQVNTTWIWPRRRLIVSEEVDLRERLGVNQVRMHLHRHLADLGGGGGGA